MYVFNLYHIVALTLGRVDMPYLFLYLEHQTQSHGETSYKSVERPLPPCNIRLSLSKQARLLDRKVPVGNILLISHI